MQIIKHLSEECFHGMNLAMYADRHTESIIIRAENVDGDRIDYEKSFDTIHAAERWYDCDIPGTGRAKLALALQGFEEASKWHGNE